LEEDGGPIAKVEVGRLQCGEKTYYQAGAWLSHRLNLTTRAPSVFPQPDGCGTHASRMLARHMAISEALERWALYTLYQSGNHKQFALDIDCTSTGMAAYPGLFRRQTRAHALREAVERYCLANWAVGNLRAKILDDQQGFEIQNPLSKHAVVMLWRQFKSGYFSYGFSAARNLDQAVLKAEIEMERLVLLIKGFYRESVAELDGHQPSITNHLEQRIMNFSTQAGHEHFLSHLNRSTGLQVTTGSPPPLIDSHLPGPWDKYTTVWRVLFPMPNQIYDEARADIFFW